MMAQRVRDICVTALSHLCVKQLEVCRVSPLLHVHSHSALPRVFFTTWETVIQFADTYHSASCPPTHQTDTSCRDAAQTALTVSTLFSSSQTSHWFMTLILSFIVLPALGCADMFPLPLSVICMHLHAGTAHESITSTRSYDEFVYVHFPSLMKTNTSGVALRCCVKTPAVVVRIFLRLSINHHSLCANCVQLRL